jgi:hypothetical protein
MDGRNRIMKKLYMTPAMDVLEYETNEELLNAVSSDFGIEYGGVDDSGEAAARQFTMTIFMIE